MRDGRERDGGREAELYPGEEDKGYGVGWWVRGWDGGDVCMWVGIWVATLQAHVCSYDSVVAKAIDRSVTESFY